MLSGKVDKDATDWTDRWYKSYKGYTFSSLNTSEFQEILAYIDTQKAERIKKLKQKPEDILLKHLLDGDSSFSSKLVISSCSPLGKSFLDAISMSDCISTLKSINADMLHHFARSLHYRYDFSNCYEYYAAELPWLEKLVSELDAWKNTEDHKLTIFHINQLILYVESAIKRIVESKP